MKNLTILLLGAIFTIVIGVVAVNGVDVKYTFDKNAVAAKNTADSAALAKEMAHPYIKITTSPNAYNIINGDSAPSEKTFLVVDVIIEDHGYQDLDFTPDEFFIILNNR